MPEEPDARALEVGEEDEVGRVNGSPDSDERPGASIFDSLIGATVGRAADEWPARDVVDTLLTPDTSSRGALATLPAPAERDAVGDALAAVNDVHDPAPQPAEVDERERFDDLT